MVLRLIFFLPLIIVGILEFSILEGGGVRGVSVYRITSIKCLGRLLNFSIFRGRCLFEGAFNRGGVYKILAIFFSHKIKTTYKILKSLQYFKKPSSSFSSSIRVNEGGREQLRQCPHPKAQRGYKHVFPGNNKIFFLGGGVYSKRAFILKILKKGGGGGAFNRPMYCRLYLLLNSLLFFQVAKDFVLDKDNIVADLSNLKCILFHIFFPNCTIKFLASV